ncbi:hypothetical protein Tco_0738357 [Tanacetum coccineum]
MRNALRDQARKKMYMIDFYTPKQSKKNKKNSIVVNAVVIGSRIRITKEEAAKEIRIKMLIDSDSDSDIPSISEVATKKTCDASKEK